MQFRQIKDPMEIIKLAITSQGGAYLNVEELVEVTKLLGLSSQDDISAVQEAIAREAAVAGDLQLSFAMCLSLAKKVHGYLDIEEQCEKLMILTKMDPPKFSTHGASVISYPPRSIQDIADLRDQSGQVDRVVNDGQEVHFETIKNTLLLVAKDLTVENVPDWDSLLRDNGKMFSFAALRLPWFLELSQFTEGDQNLVSGSISSKMYVNVRTQVVVAILSWLARNGFAPKDNLIASLAKSILTALVTEREDILGCSFLLNLVDAFHGVEIIEEQVKRRE
ncbi:hypothetical protein POM88_044927 [Heracleum sosnowskyi]|uniref:Uncharacterized protein n=1 Tax=Heracleum sosnowskyi TaxID=360622 RepID=A0AAD8M5U9_9APIA|nr:hypothetical protein POM88_044927 [Heracleum sosnowskyi]